MRRARRGAPRLLALLVAAASCSAAADEVFLRNGDRISGEVLHLGEGKLALRTRYGAPLEIDWSDVATLSTEAPLELLRRGASQPERARLRAGAPGRARLVGEGASTEVALADIGYLNPKPHESGAGTGYSGRATVSAAYARGNSESDRVYGDAELTARARPYRYGLSGKLERRAEPAAGATLAWRASANYDRFLDARRFAYLRASLEHDRAKDIERRAAFGAGYGAELIDRERASLSLRGGLDYVAAARIGAPDEHYPALGWGVKASYTPQGTRLRLFHEQEGYWDLDDTARVFLRSKTGVRMPLVERLSASAQLNVDWERRPAPGRKPTDATLLLGLDYAW